MSQQLIKRWPTGADTSDATAEQWHIKSGKTAYIASGKVTGNAYTPAMMVMDGSTAYFANLSETLPSGNYVTAVARFIVPSKAGTGDQTLLHVRGPSAAFADCGNILVGNAGNVDTDAQDRLVFIVDDSSGTNICTIFSDVDVADGLEHTAFVHFNAVSGTAIMRIDGADSINTGAANHVLSTGTLASGSGSAVGVGAYAGGGNKLAGQVGFIGYIKGASAVNDSTVYFTTDGSPVDADFSSWLIANEHGEMNNNQGTGADMTRNGTIYVGDGGN